MLNTPRLVMFVAVSMFSTTQLMAAEKTSQTAQWVAQSEDDEDGKKKARDKVNLGRQLMKTRSMPKSFPKSNRSRVGTSADMKRTAEAAAAASRAAVKEEKKRAEPKSSSKSSRSSRSSTNKDNSDIDYKERAKKDDSLLNSQKQKSWTSSKPSRI